MSSPMKFIRALLIGLLPSLVYLAVAELCYLAWRNAVETSAGWSGILGGMILGLLTMPAKSLGAEPFREFCIRYFAEDSPSAHRHEFVLAQADIWLMTLWLYATAAVICFLVLFFVPQVRDRGNL